MCIFNTVFLRASGINIPVCTVGIVIGIPDFVDAGILKKVRRVDGNRGADYAGHIIPELYGARGVRVGKFLARDAASKIEIGAPVLFHQYRRVKQPGDIAAIFSFAGD